MSDDQSFYEIQLNTPHLVLAFLGAAVVGVAIFWLGVVIGRGQGEVGGSPEWQAAIPADSSADPTETEEEGFGFYEAVEQPTSQAPAAQDPAAAAADPDTTPPASPVEVPEFRPADPDPSEPQAGEVVADSGGGLPESDPSLISGWIIQVRATPDKASADSLQSALAEAGFPAFVVSADISGSTHYRVRVGRYSTQGDARVIERLLARRADIADTWVTEG